MTLQHEETPKQSEVEFTSDPIQTRAQAEGFCESMEVAMDNLLQVIEKETNLLRDGKISSLSTVGPEKLAAVETYMSGINLARDNAIALGNLAPDAIQRMRARHGDLRPVLQLNLQVVSTARSVTDNVIETVAKAVGSQIKTKGYSASGVLNSPQSSARGIALNHTL